MDFWIILVILLVSFIGCVSLVCIAKREKHHDEFVIGPGILCSIIIGFFLLLFIIDIPSAVKGGIPYRMQSQPSIIRLSMFYAVSTGQDTLITCRDWNSECVEPNANYVIKYVPFTKYVLSIDKSDI